MKTVPPPEKATLPPAQRARRAAIVAAGLRLLHSGDYEQVQMRDVATEADVAIGTVYRYFQSKEHLFAEVLDEWASSLKPAPAEGTTDAERLRDVLQRSARAFATVPQLVKVLMTLEASDDPFASAIFAAMNERTQGIYGAALPSLDAERRRIVVKVAGATLDLLLRQWVMGRATMSDVRRTLDEAVDVLVGDG